MALAFLAVFWTRRALKICDLIPPGLVEPAGIGISAGETCISDN